MDGWMVGTLCFNACVIHQLWARAVCRLWQQLVVESDPCMGQVGGGNHQRGPLSQAYRHESPCSDRQLWGPVSPGWPCCLPVVLLCSFLTCSAPVSCIASFSCRLCVGVCLATTHMCCMSFSRSACSIAGTVAYTRCTLLSLTDFTVQLASRQRPSTLKFDCMTCGSCCYTLQLCSGKSSDRGVFSSICVGRLSDSITRVYL
jgi:hypothetical protein